MQFTPVTAEEIKTTVMSNAIKQLLHHECAICGVYTLYLFDILNETVYYDSSCGCSESYPRPSSFADVAWFINMQTNHAAAATLREALKLPPPQALGKDT